MMEKRVIRLPDGRRLVFYEFPDVPTQPPDGPSARPDPSRRPVREER